LYYHTAFTGFEPEKGERVPPGRCRELTEPTGETWPFRKCASDVFLGQSGKPSRANAVKSLFKPCPLSVVNG